MKKNILVTGGAGFIGSQFLRTINKRHPFGKVVVLDKLTYAGNMRNIPYLYDEFYEMGIESQFLPTVLHRENIDIVVNFAAESHVDRSIHDPYAFIKTDVLGVFNMIKCCRDYWKNTNKKGRFIHISTDEVYGPIVLGRFSENDRLKPTSPYSASKAAADMLLGSFIKTYNFPAIIVRPCNNFGPRQYPEKLVPMIIMKSLNNESVPIHGKGMEQREWIHVENCCEVIYEIVKKGRIGQIYNVGSQYNCTNIEIVNRIFGILDRSSWDIEYVENRPGNDSRYAIRSDKVINTLGVGKWCDKPTQAQFESTVWWYKNHLDHFRDVNVDANFYKDGEYLR